MKDDGAKDHDAGIGDKVKCCSCEARESERMFITDCGMCGYYFCDHCGPSHDDCEPD